MASTYQKLKSYRLGEEKLQKCGKTAKIICYRSGADMRVQFDDGKIIDHVSYYSFLQGTLNYNRQGNSDMIMSYRVGERIVCSNEMIATIIAYRSYNDIDIQFDDGLIVEHITYARFFQGGVPHPDHKPVTWPRKLENHIGMKKRTLNGYRELLKAHDNWMVDYLDDDGSIVYNDYYKSGFLRKNMYLMNPDPREMPKRPIMIGKKVCKNRITMAPTVKFNAGEDGLVTDFFVEHYALRAKHGCGLICVEATAVSPEGRLSPNQLGLWNDEQIEGHRKIAAACHRYGALVIPQIHYGGLGTHPDCGPLTSPTAVTWNSWGKEETARELTVPEIQRIEQCFIDAAVRAKTAGYDGVQLHGCHGYLINNFASEVNQRTDEYGGNTENRARFGCEIIEGIRKACGDDFIISVRTSGCDPTIAESIDVAECYVKAGCNYLQVSNGIHDISDLPHDETLPYNRTAALGVAFHEHFNGIVPVSLVNGIRTPDQVQYLFKNNLIDTVDLACALLADPSFTEAILYGKPYIQCFSCKHCGWGPEHSHGCPALMKRNNEAWVWKKG